MLAGFELTPTAPLGEKQRQRDQESRRSYRLNGALSRVVVGVLPAGPSAALARS